MLTPRFFVTVLALAAALGALPTAAKTPVPPSPGAMCGAAKGGMFPSPPMSGLCAAGGVVTVPVAPLGATQYQWSCGGAPIGGLPSPFTDVCTANKKYNGQCGTANGVTTVGAPTANLCALGTASTATLTSGSFKWTCTGVMPATGATIVNCAAPATPSIVQAVNEAVTATGGASGSENVRANDTAPAGSVYALAAGSTCNPISITALGVVNYTAPAGGQSCSVNYTVCNSGQCSTATLTVNGTAAPSIVNAVSETVTATAGASGSENVRANDTAPPGSVYSLAAGSTCNPISITALGVASYTAPPAGQSCTVNYTVCNSGQCSTATLTVNAPVPPPSTLSVSKSASGSAMVVGLANQFYTLTITVTNGPTSNPIHINDTLPAGVVTSGAIGSSGGTLTGCPASGAMSLAGCSLSAGLANGTYNITIPVGVGSAAATGTNTASISSHNSNCATANPACTATTGKVLITPASGGSGPGTVVTASASAVIAGVLSAVHDRFAFVPKSSGGNYAITECVKDSVTGLIWEGKPATGFRSVDKVYTNFDDATKLQVFVGGIGAGGGVQQIAPTGVQINSSTNSVGYKNAVNASALCGANNWRIPTWDELEALSTATGFAASTWFPEGGARDFWTSSPPGTQFTYLSSLESQPYARFSVLFMPHTGVDIEGRQRQTRHVRLVR